MKTCKTCKHWGYKDTIIGWEAEEFGKRRCMAARERWKIGDEALARSDGKAVSATLEERAERRRQALKDVKMYVEDGSDYYAMLITAPEFGCVLHEPS